MDLCFPDAREIRDWKGKIIAKSELEWIPLYIRPICLMKFFYGK